jgi:glycosyltransferase involved in cell wall biosynthesis
MPVAASPPTRDILLWVSLSRSGDLFPPFAAAICRARPGHVSFAAVPAVVEHARALERHLTVLELPFPSRRPARLFHTVNALARGCRRVFAASRRDMLVHVLMPSPLDLLLLVPARLKGARILMTIHDAHLHPGENGIVQRILYRLARCYADAFVTVSNFVYAEFLENSPRQPVHVVQNGLIEELGQPGEVRVRQAKAPLHLLFHGRIRAYKGLAVLLEAMALIERRRSDITLTIAGEGADAELKARATGLGTVRTMFERTSDAVRSRLYESADVNVLPYLEASQSGVAQRGLFAALPTIATNVGALPEQLHDGENCLLVPPRDAVALADAIETLTDRPELYNRLSRGARACALALHPDLTAARWSALYDRV